jgi:DNA-binding NarL/FixJ family response regulator
MANAVRRRDATKTDRRRAGKLLTEVRDLDTNEIIIDDIAISIAVRGNRLVSLTQTERRIVTKRLLSRGYEDKEIAAHLGVRVQTAVQIIQGVRDVKEAQHDS